MVRMLTPLSPLKMAPWSVFPGLRSAMPTTRTTGAGAAPCQQRHPQRERSYVLRQLRTVWRSNLQLLEYVRVGRHEQHVRRQLSLERRHDLEQPERISDSDEQHVLGEFCYIRRRDYGEHSEAALIGRAHQR